MTRGDKLRNNIRFRFILILTLIVALAAPIMAYALSSVVTRITNNSYGDYYPEVGGPN